MEYNTTGQMHVHGSRRINDRMRSHTPAYACISLHDHRKGASERCGSLAPGSGGGARRLPQVSPRPIIQDMHSSDDPATLRLELVELRIEHSDLDRSISHMAQISLGDELMLRRMKKRKLMLKDRIAVIERLLGPDLIA